jgi:hypothetical protein
MSLLFQLIFIFNLLTAAILQTAKEVSFMAYQPEPYKSPDKHNDYSQPHDEDDAPAQALRHQNHPIVNRSGIHISVLLSYLDKAPLSHGRITNQIRKTK